MSSQIPPQKTTSKRTTKRTKRKKKTPPPPRVKPDGPTCRLFVSKAIRRQAQSLPEDDQTDWCTEFGLPYKRNLRFMIDIMWLRHPEYVFDVELKHFCVEMRFGGHLLQFCNKESRRIGYFENNQDVLLFIEDLRLPAASVAKYRVGFVCVKKWTNELVKITRIAGDKVYPWDGDQAQTMYVRHVDSNGAFEKKKSGWVSNSELVVYPDLRLQPTDSASKQILLEECAANLLKRMSTAKESLEFLISKLCGRIYLTLHAGNVRKAREICQDVPCSLVEYVLEPFINKLMISLTFSNADRSRFVFSIRDVEKLKCVLEEESLWREGNEENCVFFVLCTPRSPVIFEYSYAVGSQKLKVKYSVAQGDMEEGIVYTI